MHLALTATPIPAGMREDRAARPAVLEATGAYLKVTESYARRSMVRTTTPYGFLVGRVVPDSPAARAGLRPGDILLTWGGRPLTSVAILRDWLDGTARGTEVPITVARKKADAKTWSRDPWQNLELRLRL